MDFSGNLHLMWFVDVLVINFVTITAAASKFIHKITGMEE